MNFTVFARFGFFCAGWLFGIWHNGLSGLGREGGIVLRLVYETIRVSNVTTWNAFCLGVTFRVTL